MLIVEVFRADITATDGEEFSLGEFTSYEDAYDAAILWASDALPKERLKSFRITKTFANAAV